MKVIPDFGKASREGLYVWQLARNLLSAKRRLRSAIKHNFGKNDKMFYMGVENEAHNRYYAAMKYFKI